MHADVVGNHEFDQVGVGNGGDHLVGVLLAQVVEGLDGTHLHLPKVFATGEAGAAGVELHALP